MHPALSVIFFTTLSGAGYGLLIWLGLSSIALYDLQGTWPAWTGTQLVALALGLALATIGLLCSVGHLGKPGRAWRAFSQWRTSWLSREGVLAAATFVPALAFGAIAHWGAHAAAAHWGAHAAAARWLLPLLGAVLAACATATVVCTAMIYASLKPIPAWRHPLVVPVYLLFALLTGLALLFTVAYARLGRTTPGLVLLALAIVAAMLVALKWRYWLQIDRDGLPATRGDAIGLPGRAASVFERPHTEANYITDEMAFRIARDRGRSLRIGASALLLGGPALAFGCLGVWPGHPAIALGAATLLMLAGAFVERWLFFAQARHVVTLYY